MKFMFASDIHGAAECCERMIAAFEKEKADKLILLGDILYHGPRNDLPEDYAPKEVIRMLCGIREKILCVRGNCDAEVDQMVLPFPIMADYMTLVLGGRIAICTHGHLYEPENFPNLGTEDIVISGHTHIPRAEKSGENIFINPGSVSIPKAGNPRSYAVFENDRFFIKKLDGEIFTIMEIAV